MTEVFDVGLQVLEWTGEYVPTSNYLDCLRYDSRRDCVDICEGQESLEDNSVVMTTQMAGAAEVLGSWLATRQSFILIGTQGCGKR